MNTNSLIKHYQMMKCLVEMGKALSTSKRNDISLRMKWVIHETEEDVYTLFFTKLNTELQLVRINKEKKAGFTIGRTSIGESLHYVQNNSVYPNGKGFTFRGISNTIKIVDCKGNPQEIEAFPSECSSLILNDLAFDALYFQYSTLYDFSTDAFFMYCLFSLLVVNDDVVSPEGSESSQRMSFLDVALDEDYEDVCSNLNELKTKLLKDLS